MEVSQKPNSVYRFQPYHIKEVQPTHGVTKEGICPKARSGHRIIADDRDVYSFGGYNPQPEVHEMQTGNPPTCPLFRELWKCNQATGSWTKLQTKGYMPEELASHAAVRQGDNLLVFGGTGVPFGMSSSNRLHKCNLRTLQWNELQTKGNPPLEQYGQAIVVYEDTLYVVGGTTGFEYSMDIHKLNLKTLEWEELSGSGKNTPKKRYRHEIAVYKDKIFVFGGGTATLSFGFKRIPVFDLKTRDWERVKTNPDDPASEGFPAPRRCHGLVQLGNDVFISGGHNGAKIFPDIWKINLDSLIWKKLPTSLPQPVYFHSAALSPSGQMFIFGGVTSIEKNTRTKELYSMWLKAPTLLQMSWQAVLQYIPNITELKLEKLLQIGIPQHLLALIDFASPHVKVTGTEPAMP